MDLVVHLLCNDTEAQERAKAKPLTIRLDGHEAVRTCVQQICEAWELDSDRVRLVDYYNQKR